MKKYRENNLEIIKKYAKDYRDKNKESLNSNKRQVIVCSCGKSTTKAGKSKHEHTKFHLEYLKSLN